MTTIQKYFLCALAFNTVYVSAMENKNELVIHKVNNKINLHHLGIGKYDCCKSITIPITSYYQSSSLSEKYATTKIKEIQSYIPATIPNNERKQIFSELSKKHSYVFLLMENLVQHKLKQFKKVKGSTIDALYNPDFTHDIDDLEQQIYADAKKRFCDYLRIDSYRSGGRGYSLHYYDNYEGHDKLFLVYLYHTAFENSRSEKKEHEALNNSETAKLIQNK